MDFGAILLRMPIFLVQYPILIWRLKMSFISPTRIQTVTVFRQQIRRPKRRENTKHQFSQKKNVRKRKVGKLERRLGCFSIIQLIRLSFSYLLLVFFQGFDA